MGSNFQGRKRGKSVSFRGQSNDSNFYDRSRNDNSFSESRQRNQNRDQCNFESTDASYNEDSRTVKLLPDANMTISVHNDFRVPTRGRSRGSRGIVKSHSFRDDTNVYNRSSDYNDDYNGSSRRGFEAHTFQGNRGRGRARGFFYRPQHVSKFAEDNQEDDYSNNHYNNEMNFRGRSKSTSDRNRRGRGTRGRSRYRPFNRSSDDHFEGPTSGDGDKEDSKEFSDNLENYSESKTNENDVLESPVLPKSCDSTVNEEEKEKSEITKESESDIKSDSAEFVETVDKPVENEEVEEEHDKHEETVTDKSELS